MNEAQLKICTNINNCSICPLGYTLGGKYYKCGADKTKEQILKEIADYNNEMKG